MTFTFSGAGTMAPIVCRVTGLSEQELPAETSSDGFLAVPIPGLCVGGSVDPRANNVGYIVFTGKSSGTDVSVDKRFFDWYEETVYKQFIQDQRECYDNCDPSAPVSDSNTAVSWFDGEQTQLAARTQAHQLTENTGKKIRDCKHSASRTQEEQGCDCSRCFATIKKIQATVTMKDLSSPLKMLCVATFNDLKRNKILCLPGRKEAALVDLLACVPTIIGKACTNDAIQGGMVENGMLDSESKKQPCLRAILGTCVGLSAAHEALILENLTVLLDDQMKYGRVREETFDLLEFPIDTGTKGNERRREAGISQEHRQRR